ncbi:hypothetical protein EYF80_032152 [Liparis tanakae]|uniref:Uncharacterized protein n=1 Tax=Liparis tanakae TaxID=230148 RepID=A0A4Z2GY88_9TELE|nr:hypothetical protein EYF80_032152 [Liparis tanakae]
MVSTRRANRVKIRRGQRKWDKPERYLNLTIDISVAQVVTLFLQRLAERQSSGAAVDGGDQVSPLSMVSSCPLRAPGSSQMSFSGMVQTSAGPQQFAFYRSWVYACMWVRGLSVCSRAKVIISVGTGSLPLRSRGPVAAEGFVDGAPRKR